MRKLKRRIKYYLFRLFRLNESPHRVAAGFTLGMAPSWIPTFGLDLILSVSLAKMVRVNTVATVVGGVIGTTIWPLLFLLNYKVGGLILNRKHRIDELEEVDYIHALNHTFDGMNSIHSKGYLFLFGAMVNILISSIFIYIFVYFLFKKYRTNILRKMR